jgi:hypothetical protein
MPDAKRYRRQATARDLRYFGNPSLWPHYPFLPLIRQAAGRCERELGVLYDAYGVSGTCGYRCTVFLSNLFCLPASEAKLLGSPRQVFDTFDELADAGWTVD